MAKTVLKFLFVSGFILTALLAVGWITVKEVGKLKAGQEASLMIEQAYRIKPPETDDEKIIALTKQVFKTFNHANPAQILLLRIRPYLTNRRLPAFIRLPDGVIEIIIKQGLCDNAARALAFILKQEGFESVQWNMVTDKAGHSALLVTMPDGRKVLADPFYGYVTTGADGKLTHLENAIQAIHSGQPFEKSFLNLGKNSDPKFYKYKGNMFMAAEGNDLVLDTTLPRINNEPLFIGEIDGKELDVKSESMKNNMTPYWQYMGHKYNREWVRVLTATQPVRLVITLVAPAEKGILIATPAPRVDGNTLSWNLQENDTITFHDGKAKISWKRLNSFIGIDQIAIYPQ